MAKVISKKNTTKGISSNVANISSKKSSMASKTVEEIRDIIHVFQKEGNGLNEMKFENKDFKIILRKQASVKFVPSVQGQSEVALGSSAMPPTSSTPNQSPISSAAQQNIVSTNNQYIVKSPMVGTFYSRPSPDKPAFVTEGTQIKQGQTLGLIEAMKLFNEIESEVSGKIIKVFVEDATPVEFDQPLFIVEK